jgi:hypothetical protein
MYRLLCALQSQSLIAVYMLLALEIGTGEHNSTRTVVVNGNVHIPTGNRMLQGQNSHQLLRAGDIGQFLISNQQHKVLGVVQESCLA